GRAAAEGARSRRPSLRLRPRLRRDRRGARLDRVGGAPGGVRRRAAPSRQQEGAEPVTEIPTLELDERFRAAAAAEGLLDVGYGETTTYGELAARAGNPRAARAVGTVMNRNPVPIVLPCHRVVGANGSLTGYGGGLHRKEQLLRLEGAIL